MRFATKNYLEALCIQKKFIDRRYKVTMVHASKYYILFIEEIEEELLTTIKNMLQHR